MSTSASKKRKVSATPRGEPPKWGKNVRLSSLDSKWQPHLYLKKVNELKDPFIVERKVKLPDFEKYGILECFQKWGWDANLVFAGSEGTDVYGEEIKEWMASLKRDEGDNSPFTRNLTGKVHGKTVTMSMEELSKLASFDSGVKMQPDHHSAYQPYTYSYPTDATFFSIGMDRGNEWNNMIDELFVVPDGNVEKYRTLWRKDLKPLPLVLSKIVNWNIMPRYGDMNKIRNYEVRLLHALVTGRPAYSFRHIAMMNIWESRESSERGMIPHCYLLSQFLKSANVIPKGSKPKFVVPKAICREKLKELVFKENARKYILKDRFSGRTYEVDRPHNEEGMEVEEPFREEQLNRPEGYGQWSTFERAMFDRQEQHHRDMERRRAEDMAELREIIRGQIYMAEKYYNHFHEHTERVRHHKDLKAGRGYTSTYTPVDYSQLPYTEQMTLPPYSGVPPGDFWQPAPRALGEESSNSQHQNPFDTSTMLRGLWNSVFPCQPKSSGDWDHL